MRNLPALLFCSTFAVTSAATAQTGMIMSQCRDDVERLCTEVTHIGGAVRLCLGQNRADVSAGCRAAMDAAGPGNGRFGWGGPANRPDFMGLRQILTSVEAAGYTDVREIEYEGGHYAVEATNADGVRMELYVDAVTGDIISVARDDE